MNASRTRIKFCGITRAEDAQAAARLGADAIGLVFAAGSPRFISPDRAAMIRGLLSPPMQTVALFRNAEASLVREVLRSVAPDVLQFHGDETPEFCASFGCPYWRAVPMAEQPDLDRWEQDFAGASALVLDGHAAGAPGGQGVTFDWNRAAGAGKPVILAGGLAPENVGAAVRQVRPYAVDVSSGIEAAPGIKDADKMRRFVEQVRGADGV